MYRLSPAKALMNPATSSRPRIESAASWSPAIQPAVRVSSAAMSSSERLRPITPSRNLAASEGVKRRSAPRSSPNWPRARPPARGGRGRRRGGGGGVGAPGRAARLAQGGRGGWPGQGWLWILAGGDDEVHPWRQVIEQKGEGIV